MSALYSRSKSDQSQAPNIAKQERQATPSMSKSKDTDLLRHEAGSSYRCPGQPMLGSCEPGIRALAFEQGATRAPVSTLALEPWDMKL